MPSVVVSTVLVGAINGYTLSFWRFRGANLVFAILLFGIFVPYQVFVFPLIRIIRVRALYGTLPGIVLIHVMFGMPIDHPDVPQLLRLASRWSCSRPPASTAPASSASSVQIMLPMSVPIIVVAVILAGHRHLERLPLRPGVRRPRQPADDGAAQQHRPAEPGVHEYNVDMAATLLTAMVPLPIYFVSGQVVRPRHRRRRGEGLRMLR